MQCILQVCVYFLTFCFKYNDYVSGRFHTRGPIHLILCSGMFHKLKKVVLSAVHVSELYPNKEVGCCICDT